MGSIFSTRNPHYNDAIYSSSQYLGIVASDINTWSKELV